MRYRNSYEVIGKVKNVTVSQSCGKWYISIQTEFEHLEPKHQSVSMIGIEVGLDWLLFQMAPDTNLSTVLKPVNISWPGSSVH